MSRIQPPSPVLRYLQDVATPLADAAISDGLVAIAAEQTVVAVDLLLARARPSSYRVLIERYDGLPADQQRRVQAAGSLIMSNVDDLVHSGSSQSRVNALTVLRAGLNPTYANLAADALADRSADVRRAAADTLRGMTETVISRADDLVAALREMAEPSPAWQSFSGRLLTQAAKERQGAIDAMVAALDGFTTHHQTDVIESALLLCDDLGPLLFEHQTGQRGRFTQAIAELLSRTTEPRLAPAIYEGLPHPELERPLLQFICGCRAQRMMMALIEQQWRAARPEVGAALRQVHALAWLDQGVSPLMMLPADLHAPGIRWLGRLGLPEELLMDLLRGVLDYDSESAWTAAVWAVATHRTPKALQLLKMFADVPFAPAARAARLVLATRTTRMRAAPAAADASERWAAFLRASRLEATFDCFWSYPDHIDVSADISAEDVLCHIPDFEKHLRSRLCSAALDDRRRALTLVAAVHMEDACKNDLFTLADDTDAGIRAGVMVALGRIGDATSRRILERGVNDSDPHVRTAAIESMAAVNPQRCATTIRSRLTDDVPAVRIAAIRTMLVAREPDAAVALVRTLSDDSAPRRLAALSLAAQLKLIALRPRLESMAADDPEQQVRQRAGKLLQAWIDEGIIQSQGEPAAGDAAAASLETTDQDANTGELQPA